MQNFTQTLKKEGFTPEIYIDDKTDTYFVGYSKNSNKKYYRLFCTQNNTHLYSGYNAHGLNDLYDQYSLYKSIDWEEEEMMTTWKEMTPEQKMHFILDDCFEIESSYTPFEDNE